MCERPPKRTALLLSKKMFEYLDTSFADYHEYPENVTLNT